MDLEAVLVDNDGRLLESLLGGALRLAHPYAGDTDDGITDITITGPVVELLAHLGDRLPHHLTAAAVSIVYDHLVALGTSAIGSDRLQCGSGLVTALRAWEPRYHDHHEKALVCLLLLASLFTGDDESALLEIARRDPDRIGEVVENANAAEALAHRHPELLLRLAGCYYLNRELFDDPDNDVVLPDRRTGGRFGFLLDDEEGWFGVREHVIGLPLLGADKGPFAVLLRVDHRLGLRLIGALVDTATRVRAVTEARWGKVEHTIELELPAGAVRVYSGDSRRVVLVPGVDRRSVPGNLGTPRAAPVGGGGAGSQAGR